MANLNFDLPSLILQVGVGVVTRTKREGQVCAARTSRKTWWPDGRVSVCGLFAECLCVGHFLKKNIYPSSIVVVLLFPSPIFFFNWINT